MFLENSGLYQMHEWHKASFAPLQMLAKMGRELYTNPASPLAYMPGSRHMAAGSELLERVTRKYNKPEFGLTETIIDGKPYKVTEKAVMEKPFCTLLKFQHHHTSHLPKMLVVAPLSGHYATLLRGTVEALIPHFEVYITDWMDAREVPVYEGSFDLDDYIDYVHEFISVLGPEVHVLAVCQPAVPVLAAVSIMNAEENPKAPRSMTLIGGPIDTRINPTEVNRLAYTRSLNWFEQHVVTRVPFNYPGFMRRVYPGFLQLSGFMQLNLERHIGEHIKLFQHLVKGDGESAESHRKFYNEYLSVLDLPAEFYLQTIKTVFQDHALPRGKMVSRGRKIQPSAITRTALLTLEGELDDISGVGQTKAAQKLCKNLPEDMKHHHCQPGVGHYGIFNGRKYREHVVPIIVDFCNAHHKEPAAQVSSLRSASL